MNALLLLVLIQISTGRYNVEAIWHKDIEICEVSRQEILKNVPKKPGFSYATACVIIFSTTEQPS